MCQQKKKHELWLTATVSVATVSDMEANMSDTIQHPEDALMGNMAHIDHHLVVHGNDAANLAMAMLVVAGLDCEDLEAISAVIEQRYATDVDGYFIGAINGIDPGWDVDCDAKTTEFTRTA